MGNEVVRLKRLRLAEPEIGNLGQHLALARNAIGHDHVKGRNPVRRHEQQTVAEVKNLAHLAALELAKTGQVEFEQRSVRHGGNMKPDATGAKPKVWRVERCLRVVGRG